MDLQDLLSDNHFAGGIVNADPHEEAFAADWDKLLRVRANHTPWEILREFFVELNFPVLKGMSKHPDYLAAKRRGLLPESTTETAPIDPLGVKVYLHPTAVGRIPVIEAAREEDFLLLLRCIGYHNEPYPVPASMGAAMLDNYVNWKRIELCKDAFFAQFPAGDWTARFREIRGQPACYRDSILLLSGRDYSGVPHEAVGLGKVEWGRRSLLLRREHEVAHYMTKRYYGVAKDHIHDEMIADYFGITAAFGDYIPDYALLFLGLEDPATYRKGGRLENYFGSCKLTEDELLFLCNACRSAVRFIGHCHRALSCQGGRLSVFHKLCQVKFLDMVF